MTSKEDLVRFATRDWKAIEAAKAEYWATRKTAMAVADVWQLGHDMWRFARAARPDWPSRDERAADIDTHQRVSRALRAVVSAG